MPVTFFITDSGYVLSTSSNMVWHNGQTVALQPLNAGGEVSAIDIGEDGTVIGIEADLYSTEYPWDGYVTYSTTWAPGSATPGPLIPVPSGTYTSGAYPAGIITGTKSVVFNYQLNATDNWWDLYANGQEIGSDGNSTATLLNHNQTGDVVGYSDFTNPDGTYGEDGFLNSASNLLGFMPLSVSNKITTGTSTKIYIVGVTDYGHSPSKIFWWDGMAHSDLRNPLVATNIVDINAATTTVTDANGNATVVPAPQIVCHQTMWEMNPTTGLFGTPIVIQDLLPVGYNGFENPMDAGISNSAEINDAGVIIGATAATIFDRFGNPTYNGDGTLATNGMYALLLPVQIERRVADQPTGTYTPISTASPYPQNVVVAGQFMDLKLVQTGTTVPITNIQWVIDGTTFKNYVANNSTGTLTQLASTDLTKTDQTVQFFWADAGSKNVVCKFNVGSAQTQVSYKFTVLAPTNAALTRPITRGPIGVAYPWTQPDNGLTYLYNGGLPNGGTPGIQYTYTYTPVPTDKTAYPVQVAVVQLRTPNVARKITATQVWQHWTSTTPLLDTIFPYPPSAGTTSTSLVAADSPATPLNEPGIVIDKKTVTNDTFDVWLICRSLQGNPGVTVNSSDPSTISSCWVPISHFTWSWSAAANYTGGQWVNDTSSASVPAPPTENATNIQPQWTDDIENLPWQ